MTMFIVRALFAIGLYRVYCLADEPYFTKSPKDVAVVVGASVTLPCEATPGDGIVYYWELNGSKVINTTRRFMQGSDLHITRADRERDVGEFTCIVEDISRKNAPITSSTASLIFEFIEEPEVLLQEPPQPEEIKVGSTVMLKCHLDASGDVQVTWFRNAHLLNTNSSKIDVKKRRLAIKQVDSLDNGVYRCEARNSAGTKRSTKNFILAVEGENSPLIQTIPKDQIVKKGTAAYFHCAYQRAEVLEWYFNESGPLKTNDRIAVHSNGTLEIKEVGESDVGWYNCVGIKSESTEIPQSYTAELALAFIEPFGESSFEPPLKGDGEKPAGEGTTFQLTCLEPNSFPSAKKWWQNAAGHTISDRGDIYVDDGRLIITKVKRSDAGKYTCVAENVAGKTEKSVEVVVTTKPKVTQHPESITVDENDKSTLTCQYDTSHPKYTTVRWRKDGKPLKHEFDETISPSRQRIRVYKHNGTLVIHSTQSSDRGEYVCEVITEGFEAVPSLAATISVTEKLRFVPPPVNKKLELDSTGKKIHCKAQGTPPPLVHWEKEGMSPPDNFPPHITDMNGTLNFNRVTAGDKGKYHCIASNSQGTINASINIDVVVAPRFVVPPKTPINVNEGDSVMIDCIVEGDPEPTVQWDKNSKMNDFDSTRFTVLENGSMYIKEVWREDQNKYGCTAGSSAGLNRKEVELFVHTRDGFHNTPQQGDTTVTKAVLITMSVAGAYIVLVIGLMVWCRYRRKSRKLPIGDGKLENGEVENQELKGDAENGVGAGPSKQALNGIETHREGQRSDGAETCNSQASGQSKKSKSSYDRLALSRTLLKDLTLIGRGEFGDVMIAKLSECHLEKQSKRTSKEEEEGDDVGGVKEVSVLVKVLTQTKDEHSLTEFKREIDMFGKLSHENVTKLLGLCREQEPHYLIMEHTEWGDLKKFLLATKTGTALTTIQGVAVAHQVSRAMDYLANQRLVHKDLAARNCLITSSLVVKIGLPRMTKEPYSQEYCKHANQIIPLRWLPYEAVYEDEYSTKSDIYSYAVLVWEIFARGELPHSKINDTSFLAKLKEKKLEWKPHAGTPEALQKIQELCWDVNPQTRPSFGQIANDIKEILKSL